MKFTIPGTPISVNHAYGQNRNGRRFLTAAGKYFKEEVAWNASIALKTPKNFYKYPIQINLSYFYGDKRKRDIDNGIKLCLDAMTNIIYKDDSEIVCLNVKKDFAKEPRIEIEIIQL